MRKWSFVAVAVLVGITSMVACSSGENDQSQQQPTGDPVAHGEGLFLNTCSQCHGQDATGVSGLGKDLVASEFVGSLSDEELIDFIETGRPADDPNNTTGVAMPPKGGNSDLTEEDLADIVAYIRSLRQ